MITNCALSNSTVYNAMVIVDKYWINCCFRTLGDPSGTFNELCFSTCVTNNNNIGGVRVLFKGQICPSLLSAPRHKVQIHGGCNVKDTRWFTGEGRPQAARSALAE